MNNITRYSDLQRKLHWIIVLLVAGQYALQSPMRAAMADLANNVTLSALDFLVTTVHTWGGAGIGAIMVYRLWLRVQNPVPVGAGQITGVWRAVVLVTHWTFYGLLFFMVVTGSVHYYFGWHWVAHWHEKGEWLLLGLILMHGLAALLHRFYKKDAVLSQMWGSRPPH